MRKRCWHGVRLLMSSIYLARTDDDDDDDKRQRCGDFIPLSDARALASYVRVQ